MLHRHLTHEERTLAAADDVIALGRRQDCAALRRAALGDRLVLDKVRGVCLAHASDLYAQRDHFWWHDAETRLA